MYDISATIHPGMVVYAGDSAVEITSLASVASDGYAVSRLCLGSHTGTHIDPPAHFIEGGAEAHDLPLDAMIGPCVLRRFDAEYAITAAHLESANVPEGTERLILSTPSAALFDEPEFSPNYTALSLDGAEWCVRRGLRLVGIDYLSIERPDYPTAWGTHKTLLGAGVVVLEGLDTRGVPEGDYELVCLPLKIRAGDGALARAVLL